LVAIGWSEGSVGFALSIMGFTALAIQTYAGDIIDNTSCDRRRFLSSASIVTALCAMSIVFVSKGNDNHTLVFASKFIEGISSSFIAPCLAALTMATFGPDKFDDAMASNMFWGHVGSCVSALLAGTAAYALYPNIQYCFVVIGSSAIAAVGATKYLPEGDPLLGRGLEQKYSIDTAGSSETEDNDIANAGPISAYVEMEEQEQGRRGCLPALSSYWSIFSDRKTIVLCFTGFFFHFANANVLLVLGELMGGDNEDGSVKRNAIPLIACAIIVSQVMMSVATFAGDAMTKSGWGRRPLIIVGLLTVPIRCALIIFWKDAGEAYLLSTQVLDGLGDGILTLMHPILVADVTFGTGRFNLLMGFSASWFGLGATLSNLLGQIIVERMGHVASLIGSFALSIVAVVLYALAMPETRELRRKMDGNKRQSLE